MDTFLSNQWELFVAIPYIIDVLNYFIKITLLE